MCAEIYLLFWQYTQRHWHHLEMSILFLAREIFGYMQFRQWVLCLQIHVTCVWQSKRLNGNCPIKQNGNLTKHSPTHEALASNCICCYRENNSNISDKIIEMLFEWANIRLTVQTVQTMSLYLILSQSNLSYMGARWKNQKQLYNITENSLEKRFIWKNEKKKLIASNGTPI